MLKSQQSQVYFCTYQTIFNLPFILITSSQNTDFIQFFTNS